MNYFSGVTAQAVSHRLLMKKAPDSLSGNSFWIRVEQTDAATGFSPSFPVSSVIIIPPLHHIYSCIVWGMDIGGQLAAAVAQRHSVKPP
jgi:hypothetical protein